MYVINKIITSLSRAVFLQSGCRNLMGTELKIMTQLDESFSFRLALQSA